MLLVAIEAVVEQPSWRLEYLRLNDHSSAGSARNLETLSLESLVEGTTPQI